ncbi:MAG: aminopeptidase [Bacteriovoracaceae bacterium]
MDLWIQFLKHQNIKKLKTILNIPLGSLFTFSLLFCSCAKLSYLWEQGPTQLKIHFNAIPNDKVLKDPLVTEEQKRKIRKIGEYKEFFLNYFDENKRDIYTKTYFLKNEAASYLVISSPLNEVKAETECFIIMGCFPYLGFFEKESALKYKEQKEKEHLSTYMRPVYAYSTLNYFNDPILSSFFNYDDLNLAEVIFHELFHTLFFVKSDVDFNENLANFFSKELMVIYFQDKNSEAMKNYLKQNSDYDLLNLEIKKFIKILNEQYAKKAAQVQYEEVLTTFLSTTFIPYFKQFCKEHEISDSQCFPLNRKWNNAVFAAYATYESEQAAVKLKFTKMNKPLKEFFVTLKNEYRTYYENEENKQKFSEYFLRKNE